MLPALHCARTLAFLLTLPLAAQVNVLTYQYDNTRAGVNPNETLLTRTNVNQNRFGKLFSHPVDGYVYGQPLYLSNVTIAGKGIHNIVYVATEHDSVYAFDADSNAGPNTDPLWHVSFINAAGGVTTVPYADVNCDQIMPEIGITSTPVIDAASGTIYVVAMTKESAGGRTSYFHRLHALDVSSGAERPGSPVAIQASYPGTGDGGSTVVFAPKDYKQRPGLLLLNGIVYTAWSSHCDNAPYHGWLIGYDAKTLQQVRLYNTTPNGTLGSFWTSGAAPAADAAGNIYVVAANGTFDAASGGPDLGESYIKLSSSGALAVQDYFTPFNFAILNDGDMDIGSAGVVLLADEAGATGHPHLMVGAGKEGRIYVLDRDNMGKWQAGSDSQIVDSFAKAIYSLFGNPAYFNKTVYFCAAGDSLSAFSLSNGKLGAPTRSPVIFDFPGCVPTISASGGSNAIVWLLEPSATLRAYDASNLASELYNSNQNPSRDQLDSYVKFSVPTVANGKVYAGTQGSLEVYGLLAAACSFTVSPPPTFAASGGASSVLVSTSADCGWGATSNTNWIAITSGSSGVGSGTVSFTVQANTGAARAGTLTIAGQTLTVNQSSSPISSNQFFVTQLYLDLLNRQPDPAGLTFWTGQLNAGVARKDVAYSFFSSAELQGTGNFVIAVYAVVLGRDPDFNGWLSWLNGLRGGLSQNTMVQQFISSPEFVSTYGSLSNTQFVQLVYRNALGRQPDSGGLAYWAGQLNGGLARGTLMYDFIISSEFQTLIQNRSLVDLLYLGFLRRGPEPAGQAFWLNAVNNGLQGVDAIDQFLGSAEYLARFQ